MIEVVDEWGSEGNRMLVTASWFPPDMVPPRRSYRAPPPVALTSSRWVSTCAVRSVLIPILGILGIGLKGVVVKDGL